MRNGKDSLQDICNNYLYYGLHETDDGFVQDVRIEAFSSFDNDSSISEFDKYKIRKLVTDNYGINKENITVSSK